MEETRVQELFSDLYSSSKRYDSWQRYVMIRELRELMKQPKGGFDHFKRFGDDRRIDGDDRRFGVGQSRDGADDDEEQYLVLDEELAEIEDRAVENETNTKMISAMDKEEPIPQLQVHVYKLEPSLQFHNASSDICDDVKSSLFGHQEAMLKVSHVKIWDELLTKSTDVTNNQAAHYLFDKMLLRMQSRRRHIKCHKSWRFKFKHRVASRESKAGFEANMKHNRSKEMLLQLLLSGTHKKRQRKTPKYHKTWKFRFKNMDLAFETGEEPLGDGKELLEASDGLATLVLDHVDDEVEAEFKTFDRKRSDRTLSLEDKQDDEHEQNQYLKEAGWAEGGRVIACTQPRRLAVQAISVRVAEEMRVNLGNVLVSLTGQDDIEAAIKFLEEEAHSNQKNSSGLLPLPLYSGLSRAKQELIFTPTPRGKRKVILATTIAETSLTLEGVVYVIDSGFSKQEFYNPISDIDGLVVAPISKASARPRYPNQTSLKSFHQLRVAYLHHTSLGFLYGSLPRPPEENHETWSCISLRANKVWDPGGKFFYS